MLRWNKLCFFIKRYMYLGSFEAFFFLNLATIVPNERGNFMTFPKESGRFDPIFHV